MSDMNGQTINTTQLVEQDQALMMWIYQSLLCTIRGIIGCFPQHRAEKVLLLIVLNLGRLVSELYAGDDIAVHRFRKSARDLFDDTTKKMPIVPLNGQPRKADTAAIGNN